jgi:hypothetical protein
VADRQQGTHFWFMSIRTPHLDGSTFVGSYQGTITPSRGRTRLDLFSQIRADIDETDPRAVGGATIAFDIQPNKL